MTDATEGHTLQDEAQDVADVMRSVGAPVFLLGHSYGAHCALLAAAQLPDRVRKLVLYEPAWPSLVKTNILEELEALASVDAWDEFAYRFFADVLRVPIGELDALRASELWTPIVSDAPASLRDLRAIHAFRFDARQFGTLDVPVLLQTGSESPRDFYVTDALAAVLPNAVIQTLAGQAHEGMTTAPDQYVRETTTFLLAPAVKPTNSLEPA